MNEVRLSQEHKAAPVTCYNSEVGAGPSTSPAPVSIPAQEIQLELLVLEMGRYLHMQIYVLSNSQSPRRSAKLWRHLA